MFLYDSGKKVEIGVDAIKIQILKVYYELDSILDSKLLTLFKSISCNKTFVWVIAKFFRQRLGIKFSQWLTRNVPIVLTSPWILFKSEISEKNISNSFLKQVEGSFNQRNGSCYFNSYFLFLNFYLLFLFFLIFVWILLPKMKKSIQEMIFLPFFL